MNFEVQERHVAFNGVELTPYHPDEPLEEIVVNGLDVPPNLQMKLPVWVVDIIKRRKTNWSIKVWYE